MKMNALPLVAAPPLPPSVVRGCYRPWLPWLACFAGLSGHAAVAAPDEPKPQKGINKLV